MTNLKVEKISSLGQFFSDPVQLNVLHSSANPSLPVSLATNPPVYKENKQEAWEPVHYEPSKSKHFWRTRNQIDPDCKVFFAFVKPHGAPKGSRVLFLYSPPLYAIFDQTKEELEMLPSSTQFYLEGRKLILLNNGTERVFTLKTDEKKFAELTRNKSKDTLLQFCYFCQLNRYLLPPVFLTNPFYNKVVNNERFYVVLSHFPPEMFSKENMDHFVRAIDPMMDCVLEKLLDNFLEPLEVDISIAPRELFVFRFILTVLRIDEAFNNLKTSIEKSKRPQEAFIVGLEAMQFNDRSKMVLHILYSRTKRYFPDMDTADKLTASTIIASVVDWLTEKNLPSKVELIQMLDGFKQGNLSPTMYKRYVKALKSFSNQPPAYQLTKKGTFSFDSFVVLLHFAWTNINKYIQVLETTNI